MTDDSTRVPDSISSYTDDDYVVVDETEREEEEEEEEEEVMIDFSHLMDSLYNHESPNNVRRLLGCFDSLLSGVLFFTWEDIFKQPLSSTTKLLDVPEPVYTDLINWINLEISDDALSDFVVESFGYITNNSVLGYTWKQEGDHEGLSQYSDVSIFVVLALVLRSKPHVLASGLLPSQGKQQAPPPLTVWMIKQASLGDLRVGLYSWVHYLLPLLLSSDDNDDLQWRSLILDLVEMILAKPGALTELQKHPFWREQCLIPPSSFEILLRLRFSGAFTQEDTTRFVKIYGSLKRMALTGALKRNAATKHAATKQMFALSLRLAAGEEGNPVLAKEAAEIGISCLTGNNICWPVWYKTYKENLEASLVLVKTLVEKWNDDSLELLSLSPPPITIGKYLQRILTISMHLAGERGNPYVVREATKVAIWSLAKDFICWICWDYMYKEHLEASVAVLKEIVEESEAKSLKLSSSSKEVLTKFIVQTFTTSLRLAGEENPILAREAAAVAVWALNKEIASWRRWDYLYEENPKANVVLFETLLEDGKYPFLELSSSDDLTVSQTMKSFLLKNKEGITEGGANGNLYKEADKSCKVILGRLRCACITNVVLATVTLLIMFYLTVFGF